MTTHTFHDDSHINGLADGCPRCEEHAEHPEQSLDKAHIRRLLAGHCYTRLDQLAAGRLENALSIGRFLIQVLEEETRDA